MNWEQIDWEQIKNIGKIIFAISTLLGAGFVYKIYKNTHKSIKQTQKAGDNSQQSQIGIINNHKDDN